MSNINNSKKSNLTLFIRLGYSETECIYWYVESHDKGFIRYGKLNGIVELDKISIYASNVVTVIVPANDFIFRKIERKFNKKTHNIKSIAFSIEQSIIGNIDDFHITILRKDDEYFHIAAIKHESMIKWLNLLKSNNIFVSHMTPDILTLPFFNNEYSAIKINDDWLVRNNEMSGFIVNSSILHSIIMLESPTVTINTYSSPDIKKENWRLIDCNEPFIIIMAKNVVGSVNLLQGKYKYAKKIIIDNNVLLRCSSFFLLLFLIMIFNVWYQTYKNEKNIDVLNNMSRQFYHDYLPTKYNENNDGFNTYMSDVKRRKQNISFINLLFIANKFITNLNAKVLGVNFNYEKEEMLIYVEGDENLMNKISDKEDNMLNINISIMQSGERKYNIILRPSL